MVAAGWSEAQKRAYVLADNQLAITGSGWNDDRADWREAWALFPGSMAYIWHAGTKAGIVQDSLGSPVCLSLATFGPRLIESCGLIS
jgi:hypothetical protein